MRMKRIIRPGGPLATGLFLEGARSGNSTDRTLQGLTSIGLGSIMLIGGCVVVGTATGFPLILGAISLSASMVHIFSGNLYLSNNIGQEQFDKISFAQDLITDPFYSAVYVGYRAFRREHHQSHEAAEFVSLFINGISVARSWRELRNSGEAFSVAQEYELGSFLAKSTAAFDPAPPVQKQISVVRTNEPRPESDQHRSSARQAQQEMLSSRSPPASEALSGRQLGEHKAGKGELGAQDGNRRNGKGIPEYDSSTMGKLLNVGKPKLN
ncbi:hypothetical protein [Massilia yuzhufengensis]|uniref:Uncharacterized protein n=1 Tax=Massilia yuzhufengensis TaxID=1164594 RepID=A0A1I1HHD6_9BURK|nr:hypothetical protein [Massilia yuzhufengensis]SFB98509.1 hypothetical protein SAMN05216204_1031 [Massilia yuzhufengensis]SFC23447.1 hypothetical protein SAMN05216204_104256 [Massilia yuzhufengensis]SFC94511.1 hypothetical protein SAMN05216204_1133 [Massilia yuzhufengensis]